MFVKSTTYFLIFPTATRFEFLYCSCIVTGDDYGYIIYYYYYYIIIRRLNEISNLMFVSMAYRTNINCGTKRNSGLQ